MEIALIFIVFFLSSLLVAQGYLAKKERDRLISMIISKSPKEFKEIAEIDNKPLFQASAQDPGALLQADVIPFEDLSQTDWESAVLGVKHGRQD